MLLALTSICLVWATNSIAAEDCSRVMSLSDYQKANARYLYTRGQPHNLSYTLIAISFAESSLGKWRVNYLSNDFGLMQVNIRTAYNTLGITNHYRRLELAERLIYDDELNVYLATSVLKHFNRNGWQDMIRSYNEGNRWRRDKASRKKADKYLQSVRENVRMFQRCKTYLLE